MTKAYLGDSVYADWDGYQVVLTTENGMGPSNTIYLEPSVCVVLAEYCRKMGIRISDGLTPTESNLVAELVKANAELDNLREYKAKREAEDAAIDVDIDRIIAGLPPLKPGKGSVALGKLRTTLGMETGPIGKVIEAAADELDLLKAENDNRKWPE